MTSPRAKRFVLSSLATFLVVLAFAWLTGVRDVMHAALISLSGLAFLPFVLFGALFALVLAMAFVGGDGHPGAGEGVVEGWLVFTPRYYRFLARRANAVTLGGVAGIAASALALWAMLAVIVVPRDLETVSALGKAREAVESSRGGYPEPDAQSHLIIDGAPALDGFGRPLLYEREGSGLLASFRLRSLGFNGLRGGDDLCTEGSTRLSRLAALLSRVTHSPALRDVRTLRCE